MFVHMPKTGHVDVGTVTGPAVSFAEAPVTVDGQQPRSLDCPSQARSTTTAPTRTRPSTSCRWAGSRADHARRPCDNRACSRIRTLPARYRTASPSTSPPANSTSPRKNRQRSAPADELYRSGRSAANGREVRLVPRHTFRYIASPPIAGHYLPSSSACRSFRHVS